MNLDLSRHVARARAASCLSVTGQVREVVGLLVEVVGLDAAKGDQLEADLGHKKLALEVLGFRPGRVLAAPLGSTDGVRPGTPVRRRPRGASVPVGDALLGRVIDAFGQPLDDRPRPLCSDHVPLHRAPPSAFARRPIDTAIDTGVRVPSTPSCRLVAASVSASSRDPGWARARCSACSAGRRAPTWWWWG